MADDVLKLWLEKDETKEFLGVILGRIKEKQEGFQSAALSKGDTDYEKGQADALLWASQIPETIMNADESTGVDP